MTVGEQRHLRIEGGIDPPAVGEDVRTLLAATVVDVCAASGLPFCAVSRVKDDGALLVAAQGGGAGLAVGSAWRVSDVPPARQAIATRRPVLLSTRDDPRLTRSKDRSSPATPTW